MNSFWGYGNYGSIYNQGAYNNTYENSYDPNKVLQMVG